MSTNDYLQLALYFAVLLALVKPLGWYIAAVYEGRPLGIDRILGPVERLAYRVCGVDATSAQSWGVYSACFLAINLGGVLACYLLLRIQSVFPLNPQHFGPLAPFQALNVAVSFATNTNWQNYGGEAALGYFVQMAGLTVQNFVSAASGMAVMAALARGIAYRTAHTIGNFWTDLVRTVLYILLPLSLLLALLLASQGVIQNFRSYRKIDLDPGRCVGAITSGQVLPMGPAASQIAIKQLGTNGGGFFNANSAHPYENPTPLTNFAETVAILLIPAALCYTFGRMVGDTRQGWALLAVMTLIFIPCVLVIAHSEAAGTPVLKQAAVIGGNMEGKEVRFGVVNSSLWAAATTAASNGSVNSMHDSYTPLGGGVAMFLMQLGEVVYGGVGSGLYGLILFAIVAVFLAGLMVGRTPEYLGKKIEAFEMKMASLAILAPPFAVLAGAALVVGFGSGTHQRGPHGFSEILYAFTSMGNNNGSAFAGLDANTALINISGSIAMLISRYWVALPVLAIAGSLARKKPTPASAGTLPTHTPLFVAVLIATIVIVGALAFIPALALGPIIEQVRMMRM
jgi:K+-transporting ATPase ATPase A chain